MWEAVPCSSLLTADGEKKKKEKKKNQWQWHAQMLMKKLVTVRNDHNAFKLVHSTTVLNLTRNELLHCSVLLPGIVEPRVVDFVSGISVNGVVRLSHNHWRWSGKFSAVSGVKTFSGGMAGMWPSTILLRVVSRCCWTLSMPFCLNWLCYMSLMCVSHPCLQQTNISKYTAEY